MRAREFIKEQMKGDRATANQWGMNEPWSDGGGGGTGNSLFRDLTGVTLPPDDIIAAAIAAPTGQQMNMAGLTKYTKPSLADRTATKVKDIAYDVVNKPSPFNPLTVKDLGTERATARYHADRIYRKETGREPPKSTDIGNRDIDQVQLNKDRGKLADIESDLVRRGYQGFTPKLDYVKIGSNVNSPVPTKIPSRDPKADVKAMVDKQSLNAARMGAAMALDQTRDQREKRNREGK
jgi:AraC-like DNA-binding protein